jgi:hypothetical protein
MTSPDVVTVLPRVSWMARWMPLARPLAGMVTVLMVLAACTHALAATPASSSGSDAPAGKNCIGAEEARAQAAGDSGGEGEDAPPKFSAALYRRRLILDASLDGVDGRELPISIEEVCNVPKARAKEAAQLAGADGVALLRPHTSVWLDGTQQQGDDVAVALEGADTAMLKVRLARPRSWREDEDGNKVPTFRTRRIDITD